MFIDLSDKNIVVAGGGNIATRRVKTLLKFTRNITVVATKVTQELMDLGKFEKKEYFKGFCKMIQHLYKSREFKYVYFRRIAATIKSTLIKFITNR